MDEIIELEHAGWRSLCAGTGADFYGSLMTDDGRMLLINGMSMTRSDVVSALRDAPPWASYEIDDLDAVAIDADVALLRYIGTGHRDDGSTMRALMSSLYVRRDGEWRLANYQQTLVE